MEKERLWSRDFLMISFSHFFIFMTFYILAVTLPQFVLDELRGSEQGIGLVITLFVITAVISRPLTGKWLEEINRRKLLNLALIISTICSLSYLWIDNYSVLLILRFIHGFAFGIVTTSTSAIALDIIPEHRKGEGVGYFSLFMSLAMVIGPFVGLWITTHISYVVMFMMVAVFSLLSLLCGMLTRFTKHVNRPSSEVVIKGVRRYIEVSAIPISIAGFVLAFSYGALSTFISVYAKTLGLERIASYFFIILALMILLTRPFTGRLFDRKGEHILAYPGIILFIIGMIWLSQAYTAPVFLITAGIIGVGYGAIFPSFMTIAVKASPGHRRGVAISTFLVFFDSGYGVGSYLLGVIAAKTNYHTMFLIGGFIMILTLIIYYLFHHRRQTVRAVTGTQNR
ncbi:MULTISPECIES: MFS transporter [Paenibacillus]|uniref:MFS transporter n=1 Tax=Paenibacillus violae TaxID=3077234 RepID=A0ABU3RID9_9BACL|nr:MULTISPECIES: MFS transporter [Paenibacillus]MDU0204032.1 MFS transporter [Paenibacillus sp. PFR10]MEC0268250.1 MFS transporter [Paenibacillus anseongense]